MAQGFSRWDSIPFGESVEPQLRRPLEPYRLCAVHGGTYMLGQSVKTISIVDDAEYPVAIDLGTEGTAFKARKAVLNLDYADGMDIQTPEYVSCYNRVFEE